MVLFHRKPHNQIFGCLDHSSNINGMNLFELYLGPFDEFLKRIIVGWRNKNWLFIVIHLALRFFAESFSNNFIKLWICQKSQKRESFEQLSSKTRASTIITWLKKLHFLNKKKYFCKACFWHFWAKKLVDNLSRSCWVGQNWLRALIWKKKWWCNMEHFYVILSLLNVFNLRIGIELIFSKFRYRWIQHDNLETF